MVKHDGNSMKILSQDEYKTTIIGTMSFFVLVEFRLLPVSMEKKSNFLDAGQRQIKTCSPTPQEGYGA